MKCYLCGGILGLLGRLGMLRWFQCKSCGMQFCVERPRRRRKRR